MLVKKIALLTGHRAAVYQVVQGSGQDLLFSAGGDALIVRWDLQNPDRGLAVAKTETQLYTLCHLAEKNLLVAGNMNGGLHWIDLEKGQDVQNVLHHQKGVFAIRAHRGQLWSAGGEGRLTRWNTHSMQPEESLKLSARSLRSFAFAHQTPILAAGASDQNIYLVNVETGALLQTMKNTHRNSVFSLAFSPDDRYLLSGGRDAQLKVWEVGNAFSLYKNIPAHMYTINAIAHHPTRPFFATASRDRSIKIWDAKHFELLKVIDSAKFGGHFGSVNHLIWTRAGEYLVSASDDRSIIVWKIIP